MCANREINSSLRAVCYITARQKVWAVWAGVNIAHARNDEFIGILVTLARAARCISLHFKKSTPTAGVLFWRAARQNGPRAWRCILASKKYKYIYIARPGQVTRMPLNASLSPTVHSTP